MTDVLKHNGRAWDQQSREGSSRWVQPVSAAAIARAREGDWSVILTPNKTVPRDWFPDRLQGLEVLCLASGGGQQAPILAAAGAQVTSYDYSEVQLAKDAQVARREGLALATLRGDMAELSAFPDNRFDLIFHPVSNVFAVDVPTVWRECARVLRPGGRLLAGFMNPDFFLFDHLSIEQGGPLEVRFRLPFSDVQDLTTAQLASLLDAQTPLEFSHSLDDQIGAQLEAGFLLKGFYEDRWDDAASPLNAYMPTSMATLGLMPCA
ncbi:MAG: class I SAM-dependent methyltransferase [Pseudomonadales bacterium]